MLAVEIAAISAIFESSRMRYRIAGCVKVPDLVIDPSESFSIPVRSSEAVSEADEGPIANESSETAVFCLIFFGFISGHFGKWT
jgi:hypothetical protein